MGAVVEIARAEGSSLRARAPRALRGCAQLAHVVVAAGRDGRDPRAPERRRLLLAGAGVALCVGTFLAGPLVGVALGIAGPWVVARVLRGRREHYRRAVDAAAAEVALALADPLAAGQSLRGALRAAARGVGGQAGSELRRAAAELTAGADTGAALQDLYARTGSARIGTIVAACQVQAGAGGDLACLLRECAQTFGEQAQLEGEVRTATAQARFTGLVVGLLPLGGALLAELASPGFAASVLGSWLTAWLVGLALAMQVTAAVAIRRLARAHE